MTTDTRTHPAPAPDDPEVEDLSIRDTPRRRSEQRWLIIGLAAVLAVCALIGAGVVGRVTAPAGHPGDTSVEAGFARDMQDHHAQAVQMAMIIRDRTTDPTVRSIAYDIALAQSQERGQMFAWLDLWGLQQASTQPAMAWMGSEHGGGHSDGMSAADMAAGSGTASMPGMASNADIARLQTLSGKPAEVLFLKLMIAHHQGGVEMAERVLQLTDRREVVTLARRMVTNQRNEIVQMQRLLAERGA